MRYRVRDRRTPKPEQVLVVSFTGAARTVAWLSQALATVTTVTAMRRRVQADGTVRVDITCHRPGPASKNSPR